MVRTSAQSASVRLLGKTRSGILGLLYTHADESMYLRQIARHLHASLGTVQRELKLLCDLGILNSRRAGMHCYYEANRSCPYFQELHGLMIKTAGLGDVLRGALAPLADKIRVGFLFGSLARGSADRESDVDVLLVGTLTFGEATSALNSCQATLGRDVNPVVYPIAEWREKVRSGHTFVKSVLEQPKVFLIGDEHELAGQAQGRMDRAAQNEPARNRRPARHRRP